MKYMMAVILLTGCGQVASHTRNLIPANRVATIATDGQRGYATSDYSEAIAVDKQKVFFVYQSDNDKYQSKAWSYDMHDGAVVGPVDLGGRDDDPHHYPNLTIDPDGFIHVFYACHADPMFYRKSLSPGDVSAWSEIAYVSDLASYPRPFIRDNGNIVVFYREGYSPNHKFGYVESSDNGTTWSAFRPLIWASGPFHTVVVYAGGVRLDDDDIHITWSWFHYEPATYDQVSYARFSFKENRAYDAAGKSYVVPVQTHDMAPIIDRPAQFSMDLTLDAEKRPVVLFTDYDKVNADDGAKVAWWDGRKWDIQQPDKTTFNFQHRFAHNPNGWVTFCAQTTSGFKLYQKKTMKDGWKSRFLQDDHKVVHPLILADRVNDRYHLFWHVYETGQVLYLWSPGLEIAN
jgi:hypothetical protein